MQVKDIIASRRKELGLTLEQIGDAVGVGKSTVAKWERGDIKNMRRDNIAKLSKVLKISPVILMEDEEIEEKLSTKTESFSPEEQKIIARVRSLTPANRAKLSELIDLYLNAQDKKL